MFTAKGLFGSIAARSLHEEGAKHRVLVILTQSADICRGSVRSGQEPTAKSRTVCHVHMSVCWHSVDFVN